MVWLELGEVTRRGRPRVVEVPSAFPEFAGLRPCVVCHCGVKKGSIDMEKRVTRRKKSDLTVQLLAGDVPDSIARFLTDIVETRSSDARYIGFAFMDSGGSSVALAHKQASRQHRSIDHVLPY